MLCRDGCPPALQLKPCGWDPCPLKKRPNGSAGSLHALDMDSSLIAMPACKHGVRLRRYEVT